MLKLEQLNFQDLFCKRWDAAAGKIRWGRNNHTLLFIIIRLTFTAVGVLFIPVERSVLTPSR